MNPFENEQEDGEKTENPNDTVADDLAQQLWRHYAPETGMPTASDDTAMVHVRRVAVKDLQPHEVAAMFPLMDNEDFERLKQDIKTNGVTNPVWLYEGKVIDGRSRLQACKELKIDKIPVTDWHGASLTAFVVSQNLARRHLTQSQKAAIAVQIEHAFKQEAKERQREAGGNHNVKKALPAILPEAPVTSHMEAREAAAKVVGVSARYVSDAKKLKTKKPHLFQRVLAGNTSLNRAVKQMNGPKPKKATKPDGNATERPPVYYDRVGEPIPAKLQDFFGSSLLADAIAYNEMLIKNLKSFSTWHKWGKLSVITDSLDTAMQLLESSQPYAVHTDCKGLGCDACHGAGWLPEWRYNEIMETEQYLPHDEPGEPDEPLY